MAVPSSDLKVFCHNEKTIYVKRDLLSCSTFVKDVLESDPDDNEIHLPCVDESTLLSLLNLLACPTYDDANTYLDTIPLKLVFSLVNACNYLNIPRDLDWTTTYIARVISSIHSKEDAERVFDTTITGREEVNMLKKLDFI